MVKSVAETEPSPAPSSLARLSAGPVDALRTEHQALERRLAELDRRLCLTAEEQVERAQIKKEKLRLKDRMVSLGFVP